MQVAKFYHTCNNVHQGRGEKIQITVIPIILAKSVISCVVVPFLLKNLHGHCKIYFVLQHLSGDFYLITLFVSSYVKIWMHDFEDPAGNVSTWTDLFTYNTIVFAISSLGTMFFYQQYAFSLLQCLNYYHMICDSLRFAEYSLDSKAVKRVFGFLGFCILLSLHGWVRCGATSYAHANRWSEEGRVKNIYPGYDTIFLFHAIFDAVAVSILKFIYTIFLIRVSIRVKASLAQSSEMSNRQNIPTIFIVSCLVPLITNILYIVSDVTKILASFYEIPRLNEDSGKWKEDCVNISLGFQNNIHLPVTASVFFLACVIHCTTYLLCFSRLRKGICFWRCKRIADSDTS